MLPLFFWILFYSGPADPTRLLSTAKSTELFGTVSMLAGSVVPIGQFTFTFH